MCQVQTQLKHDVSFWGWGAEDASKVIVFRFLSILLSSRFSVSFYSLSPLLHCFPLNLLRVQEKNNQELGNPETQRILSC